MRRDVLDPRGTNSTASLASPYPFLEPQSCKARAPILLSRLLARHDGRLPAGTSSLPPSLSHDLLPHTCSDPALASPTRDEDYGGTLR